jgi:hypothetical protein
MDFYVEDAHHLIMVARPLSRIASMYYYESGYTKQRDRGPGETEYKRIATESRFEDPAGEDRSHIQKFLTRKEYDEKWERVQWWWVREMTANRTLDEAIKLLATTFNVGLSHRFDESLLLWKATMMLDSRDILYTRMKASLPHPNIQDWAPEEQEAAEELSASSGDTAYYEAAAQQFETQIDMYGREKLKQDVQKFSALQTKLTSLCSEHAVLTEQLHVPDQTYCFIKLYDVAYERTVQTTEKVGCFKALAAPSGRYSQKAFSSEMTLSLCIRRCRKEWGDQYVKPFSYIGLGHGSHCYCGRDEPDSEAKVGVEECQVECAGNTATFCGGHDRFMMHKLIVRDPSWVDPIISADEIKEV